jgi:hypothetical protein
MDQSELYVTTLNHEEIAKFFFDEKCSASYPGIPGKVDKTHWIAEPSKIKEIDEFCERHHHMFKKVN